MPVQADRTPKQIFDELCDAQGRRRNWVAKQAGMSGATLIHKFNGDGNYRWLPGEQDKIAAALGVPVTLIWTANDTALAAAPATTPDHGGGGGQQQPAPGSAA